MNDIHDPALLLRHLLTRLSEQGEAHLAEVTTDLQQTGYLLTEAIDKLGSSFIDMHEVVTAQNEAIRHLQDGNPLTPEIQATLDRLRQESVDHVNAAITALQFQDMTSQLIGRMVAHVENLNQLLGAVGMTANGAAAGGGMAGTLAVLGAANRILEESGDARGAAPRKAVAQTHMESGDIELF